MSGSSSSGQSSLASNISISGIAGTSTTTAPSALDDFPFPTDLTSIQDRNDEAMLILKSELMAALAKEVKSLDEESWKFEAPRSRIHLMSRRGGFLNNKAEILKRENCSPPK